MKRSELLVAIRHAEMCAGRLTMRGHHLTIGERAAIARLIKDPAGVARSRFDPEREPEPDQYLGGDDVLTAQAVGHHAEAWGVFCRGGGWNHLGAF